MLNVTLNRRAPLRPGPHNNYDYAVYVNGRKIASGEVTGHDRDLGWSQLLRELLEQRVQEHTHILVLAGSHGSKYIACDGKHDVPGTERA